MNGIGLVSHPVVGAIYKGLILSALMVSPILAGERFPFLIPGDDSTKTATDLSGLNDGPAGEEGYVQVRDGKFYTDRGPLKIWGLNVCFGANFPDHGTAEKVAAHLAKLGCNGIRMHHHDNRDAPSGIWGGVVDGRRRFDQQMVDRQDYFISQLIEKGIYLNLNLHVSRTLEEAEGFVSRDLPRDVRFDKYLLYFVPEMQVRFKEFCRAYLTRFNKYRGKRLIDDPGIAMLELTNENSFSIKGPKLAAEMPAVYRDHFKSQWNRWLKEKYTTTERLEEAWADSETPLGEDVGQMGSLGRSLSPWELHLQEKDSVQTRFDQPGPRPDLPAVRLEILKPAEGASQQELMLKDLSVEEGQVYTVSFWIKSESPRLVHVDVSNQGPATWKPVGYSEDLKVQAEWKLAKRVFRATESLDKARICFKFGGDQADLYLADVRLRHGADLILLPEGQSIEKGNVEIPLSGWREQAQSDCHSFMVDLETKFVKGMISFLKEDLGAKCPITASQITYHSPGVVEETSDYVDVHGYWHHPRFPRQSWDSNDWFILNTPMEADPVGSTLLNRAQYRILDRPYTISEFNIPNPHDYGASVVPFAALVAGLQDWNGVFFFQYHSSNEDWFGDSLKGYFSFNGQPAKLALFTAFANLYRRNDLGPLETVLAGTAQGRVDPMQAFTHRIGVGSQGTQPFPEGEPGPLLMETPDGSCVWDAREPERAYVSLSTPKTRAVWGMVGNRSFDLDGVNISVGSTERNYAVIVLTSLDDVPLEKSSRILLAAVGSAENQGMVWNKDRTSVGREWGHGPVVCNGIPAQIQLQGEVKRVRVLNGKGEAVEEFPIEGGLIRIGGEYRTLWYELTVQ